MFVWSLRPRASPSSRFRPLRNPLLWQLFIAVQLVDVVWAVLVLLGVEKGSNRARDYGVRIRSDLLRALCPRSSACGDLLVGGRGARLWPRLSRVATRSAAVWIGQPPFSPHWILDFLVHRMA